MDQSYRLKAWLQAIRLRTLPLALASIAMGTFLASFEGSFNAGILIFAVTTTVLLQVLSNLANDYGDSMHGVDGTHRQGPARSVQSGAISVKAMRNAIIITAVLTLFSGILLLLRAFENLDLAFLLFILMGVLAILAALGYTMGKHPYGYAGLGDLFVVIFFGLLGVLGTCYLYTGTWRPSDLLPALSTGLFATAVLNVNNIRDIDSDRLAGKLSIPVRIGRKKAVWYHWGLLFSGFVLALVYTVIHYYSPFQFLFLLSLPLFIRNGWEVKNRKTPQALDPSLKSMALASLAFTLLFGIGLLV